MTEFLSLEDLLEINTNERPIGEINVELVNGKLVKLPIKSVTADEEKAIRRQATKIVRTNRERFEDTNDLVYNSLLIDKATDKDRTNLNWRSKELAEKVGAKTPSPEFIVPKLLSLGGIIEAVQEITKLSGIKDDFEKQVEAVKN